MKNLFNFFKQYTCNHHWMPAGEYYDDQGNGHIYKKYIWKCKKCGRVKHG